jgi:hypothetical protein
MSIGQIWIDQRKIHLSPIYQREAGVWSIEKKTLFIDSILNGYDVPKLYFNELPIGEPYDYAVIDGKQRVSTLIDFINNAFPLAEDFIYTGSSLAVSEQPLANQSYSQFHERAKEVFRGVLLAVTKVSDANEEDIESLFARLNNGEKLNSAESRNAIGGEMAAVIREISERPFFKEKVRFSNNRYAHREVACKLLYMEYEFSRNNNSACPDLKKKYLDKFVRDNKEISTSEKARLVTSIDSKFKELGKCFDDQSPELGKQSLPQFFYLWLRMLTSNYTAPNIYRIVKDFLPVFTAMRAQNNQMEEEERDAQLVEFGRLTQQGTNDSGSMTKRAEIMTRYFLIKHPEVKLKDPRRLFSQEERYAIWILAEKKCQQCGISLHSLSDMDADHVIRFVDGGETTLGNARCLCIPCNRTGS